MATTFVLDTHRLIKNLQERGFTEDQATGITEALQEIDLSQLTTKADLREQELRIITMGHLRLDSTVIPASKSRPVFRVFSLFATTPIPLPNPLRQRLAKIPQPMDCPRSHHQPNGAPLSTLSCRATQWAKMIGFRPRMCYVAASSTGASSEQGDGPDSRRMFTSLINFDSQPGFPGAVLTEGDGHG